MNALRVEVGNLPLKSLAYTNRVYVHPDDFVSLRRHPETSQAHDAKILVKDESGAVFMLSPHVKMERGKVGMNTLQRRYDQLTIGSSVLLSTFDPSVDVALATLTLNVDLLLKGKGGPPLQLDADKLTETFKLNYALHVFRVGQQVAVDFDGVKLDVKVEGLNHASLEEKKMVNKSFDIGQLLELTDLLWNKAPGSNVNLTGARAGGRTNMFRKDFDFEKLGIGGLTREFNSIFRRAFASRIFPSHIVSQLGINHVRGMLLFGPPGCGKTLIARKIGEVLNAREPKIVNGPELVQILNKYVGGSEEKIRELFKEAEEESKQAGDASMLHIVIFDEIDAICKQRGTVRDGTGVSDSVVNQLLSKIDGVDSLNNILVIGMTNRKDMIDDALLRPGRLEVHIEIGLPDTHGRLQILNIHTRSMREHKRITEEAIENLPELAELTKNYSGAEIEGLVKSAASYAFHRNVDVKNLDKPIDDANLVVTWQDFMNALTEVQPKFGAKSDELEVFYRNGVVEYNQAFQEMYETIKRMVDQVRDSERTPLLSVLLEGRKGTGKSALAAKVAVESGFPFVRLISADDMIGFHESAKCQHISRIFFDSYKSPLSLIFIDDIERIIDYVSIGPRFSNPVLQTLLVLLKKVPPQEGRRLLVIGTTSLAAQLDGLQLSSAFNVQLTMPLLDPPGDVIHVLREFCPDELHLEKIATSVREPLGIKQLLLVVEMARSAEGFSYEAFVNALYTIGN